MIDASLKQKKIMLLVQIKRILIGIKTMVTALRGEDDEILRLCKNCYNPSYSEINLSNES